MDATTSRSSLRSALVALELRLRRLDLQRVDELRQVRLCLSRRIPVERGPEKVAAASGVEDPKVLDPAWGNICEGVEAPIAAVIAVGQVHVSGHRQPQVFAGVAAD